MIFCIDHLQLKIKKLNEFHYVIYTVKIRYLKGWDMWTCALLIRDASIILSSISKDLSKHREKMRKIKLLNVN